MKVIGIFSQKGGQGKSFLATVFANFLNAESKKILLIDSDFPQYTIYKTREEEIDFLSDDKNKESKFYKNVKSFEIKDPFQVEKCKPENLLSVIETNKDSYEFCIVDFTGSLNTKGVDEKMFSAIDLIVVPTRVGFNDIRSNLEFCTEILDDIQKSYGFKYYVFFNHVENNIGDKKRVSQIVAFLKQNEIMCFENIFYKRKKYEKFSKDYHDAEYSTILPLKATDETEKIKTEFLEKVRQL